MYFLCSSKFSSGTLNELSSKKENYTISQHSPRGSSVTYMFKYSKASFILNSTKTDITQEA